MIFWAALLFLRIFIVDNPVEISKFGAKFEIYLHFFILAPTFLIYKNIKFDDKKIFKFLVLTNVFMFLNDLIFYIIIYPHNHLLIKPTFSALMIDYIIFFVWIFSVIILLAKILIRDILNIRNFLKTLVAPVAINVVTMFLFFSPANFAYGFFSRQTALQIFSAAVQFIIFDFAILCLICSKNRGVSLFLSGLVVLISGDLLTNYSFVSDTSFLLAYGELLWLLGMFFIWFGLLIIQRDKAYDMKIWFRNINTIKSQLALGAFGVGLLSFLPLFVIAYYFSIVNRKLFLGLPPFIMIYSVIIVLLSIFFSKRFEAPFRKIANNIEVLMSQNDKSKVDNNFSTEEFRFLQKFILESYEQKELKDRAKRDLGEIIAQVAHDIRSPLAALNTCLNHLPQVPEKQRILMRTVANRINDIANNLLEKYKGKDISEKHQHKILLLAPLLDSIISEKRLQLDKIILESEITSAGFFSFAKFNVNEMNRVLSNLINNAIESFPEGRGKIIVALNATDKHISIMVKDDGCGIPKDKLSEVLDPGVSFKKKGSGLGLSYAKDIVETSDGILELHSIDNEGTSVNIILPRVSAPSWFISTISIEPNSQVIVLDDDESIHGAWNARLKELPLTIPILHFNKSKEFVDWYELNRSLPVLVLSDYELLGELNTGLDILEELKIGNRAILITSHYEESEIIERCMASHIFLLPKSLVAHIPIELKPEIKTRSNNFSNEFFEECDYILIDDNSLIINIWLMKAETYHKKVIVFSSITDAEREIFKYDRNVPVYIDSTLENNIKGEIYAKKLYELGFKTIYLATGHDSKQFPLMYWIKAVVGKTPPF